MKIRMPDMVFLTVGDDDARRELALQVNDRISVDDVVLTLRWNAQSDLCVEVCAEETPVRGLRLQWTLDADEQRSPDECVRVMGDAWERAYGDLSWREMRAERCMPWYFAVSNGTDTQLDTRGRRTETFGVGVRPGALCLWQYSGESVTLWLDTRCGGKGVRLGGRSLQAATVMFGEYVDCSAFDAVRQFCGRMCTDALCGDDIWGSNNWYYAYGRSSHEDILRDAALVKELTDGCSRQPFMVIDDGWQKNSVNAPWIPNERFPDMTALADEMRRLGVRPGIWIRYLIDTTHAVDLPDECRRGEQGNSFDPSHPQVLEYVRNCTRMLVGWGFELIKHDFSTFDIFGKWGFQTTDFLAADGPAFYDTSKTSAEIVVALYRVILESAGETKILGCNCIGHLCAGLVHANRTGDDTSGLEWERTRKMGVNTLAFRLPQQGTFFGADADCVGIKGCFPWENNRAWLDLLARSASPLFVSCDPLAVTEAQKQQLREAYALWNDCMDSAETYQMRPLDWMENATPRLWLSTSGDERQTVCYSWCPVDGAAALVL